MPDPTLQESTSYFHIFVEAILAVLTTACTTVFGWVWYTDRSVKSLLQSMEAQQKQNEHYRLEREKAEFEAKQEDKLWRHDIKSSIENISSEIVEIKLENATRAGFDEGANAPSPNPRPRKARKRPSAR